MQRTTLIITLKKVVGGVDYESKGHTNFAHTIQSQVIPLNLNPWGVPVGIIKEILA